jgi:hypothetical protein
MKRFTAEPRSPQRSLFLGVVCASTLSLLAATGAFGFGDDSASLADPSGRGDMSGTVAAGHVAIGAAAGAAANGALAPFGSAAGNVAAIPGTRGMAPAIVAESRRVDHLVAWSGTVSRHLADTSRIPRVMPLSKQAGGVLSGSNKLTAAVTSPPPGWMVGAVAVDTYWLPKFVSGGCTQSSIFTQTDFNSAPRLRHYVNYLPPQPYTHPPVYEQAPMPLRAPSYAAEQAGFETYKQMVGTRVEIEN